MALPLVSLLEKEFIYRSCRSSFPRQEVHSRGKKRKERHRSKQTLPLVSSRGKKINLPTMLFQTGGIGNMVHKGQHGCEQQTQVSDTRER